MLKIDSTKECKENKNEKIMYFDNDDDLAIFCINPELKVYTTKTTLGDVITLADYDFTPQYYKALDDGIMFCVKDKNSRLNKNGLLAYKTCTKKINNIVPYYYGTDEIK